MNEILKHERLQNYLPTPVDIFGRVPCGSYFNKQSYSSYSISTNIIEVKIVGGNLSLY